MCGGLLGVRCVANRPLRSALDAAERGRMRLKLRLAAKGLVGVRVDDGLLVRGILVDRRDELSRGRSRGSQPDWISFCWHCPRAGYDVAVGAGTGPNMAT